MRAKIFCKFGEMAGVEAEIGAEAVLGRHPDATVQLAAGKVSGRHLRIAYEPEAGCYMLEDLGSTNGTTLDGVRVRDVERLGHLNVITLAGEYHFIFQDLERCARRKRRFSPPDEIEQTAAFEQVPELPSELAGPPRADLDHTRIDELPAVLPPSLGGESPRTARQESPRRESPRQESPRQESPRQESPPSGTVSDEELLELFMAADEKRGRDEE